MKEKQEEPKEDQRTKIQADRGRSFPAVETIHSNTQLPLQKKEASGNVVSAEKPRLQMKSENKTGLPDNLKTGIENLSGYSMDDVRVHRNSSKPAQLQAYAYAQGTDIHLGPGQERHLPHEAWHVVQQKQGRVKPTLQMKTGHLVNDNKGLEREADVMGQRVMQRQEIKGDKNKLPLAPSQNITFQLAEAAAPADTTDTRDELRAKEIALTLRALSGQGQNCDQWAESFQTALAKAGIPFTPRIALIRRDRKLNGGAIGAQIHFDGHKIGDDSHFYTMVGNYVFDNINTNGMLKNEFARKLTFWLGKAEDTDQLEDASKSVIRFTMKAEKIRSSEFHPNVVFRAEMKQVRAKRKE